ncbi:MAG TPA: aromatic-ring-hydroxylating dioxygenase subunit beta [Mycobacteriales bacterium]|nr:aromatic-ring-hydroxylating dioxygenase subunit beta [Mycobacteriales bacterium]
MSAVSTPVGELRAQVTAFLVHEADLIDQHRYDDWLQLWAPDGIYWVPCNEDDYDPRRHVSIIYDDYARLQERCFRLNSEGAHSQDPPSRLCRIVGNEQVSGDDDGDVRVRANMILVEVRAGEKNVYGARLQYTLRPAGDSFRIRQKKVVLLDNDEPLGNLTFLL